MLVCGVRGRGEAHALAEMAKGGGWPPDANRIHSTPGYITSQLQPRSELNMKMENAPANKFQGH